MDGGDDAQRATEGWLDAAVERARKPIMADEGPEDCEDCGDPIPPGRRAAMPGARLCVPCQQGVERALR